MAAMDRLERWIRRVLTDPMLLNDGAKKCIAISLMHVTGGVRTEVQTMKLGAKVWEPKQLAEMFDGMASEHSAGLSSSESGSGQEAYQLVAFFDDAPDLPQCPLPLMKKTGSIILADDPIVTEPPTARGELAQSMRHRDAWHAFALEMTARTHTAMAQIIDRLSNRLQIVEKENQDTIEIAKDMIMKEAADSHRYAMAEKEFERKTEERKRLMQIGPPLINQLLGREVFPQSTVDSTLLEGMLESLDEAQLQKLIEVVLPVLKPEQAALLVGRFTQIVEAVNARKAKKAAMTTTNGNGAKS